MKIENIKIYVPTDIITHWIGEVLEEGYIVTEIKIENDDILIFVNDELKIKYTKLPYGVVYH
ncbi:hypothetical protein FOH38_22670 [Lysinibacillus fusiformis]|nr:hypothetical protein FOH38_22670 [Lysinibacillus fusiformis]